MQDVDAIVNEALALFAGIEQPDKLEQAKARFLGRGGSLTELLKGLGKLPASERAAASTPPRSGSSRRFRRSASGLRSASSMRSSPGKSSM